MNATLDILNLAFTGFFCLEFIIKLIGIFYKLKKKALGFSGYVND